MNYAQQLAGTFCSVSSRLAHEPLIGSAPRSDYWMLLEYPQPASAKALEESQLPVEIKDYLAALQSSLAFSRLLMIRQKSRPADSRPWLYLADGREGHERLTGLPLASYADLLTLDIPAILSGSPVPPNATSPESLILVCTNGKRDACCAKWGMPIFDLLEKQYSELVWQSSHVGGHRFAPNVICLPHGIYLGRLPIEQAPGIIEQYLHGRLPLDCLRGRATYPPPVQAAEYFLRLDTMDDRLGSYSLVNFSPITENRWEIIFSDNLKKATYRIEVEAHPTGAKIFESCSSPAEQKAVKEYRLRQPIQAN